MSDVYTFFASFQDIGIMLEILQADSIKETLKPIVDEPSAFFIFYFEKFMVQWFMFCNRNLSEVY